ncbi:hypothetical protein MMC21_004592 [Puttea exsequens]|nr:hypothetical protein [Puttea exsequens]
MAGAKGVRTSFSIRKSSKSFSSANDSDTEVYRHGDLIELSARILVPNAQSLSRSIGVARTRLFELCAPEIIPEASNKWSPRDFYDNVHVPKVEDNDVDIPGIDELDCELFPFQKRAVRWLLQREGKIKDRNPQARVSELPHGFVNTTDAEGRRCFVSRYLGVTTTDEGLPLRIAPDIRGGLLAEEMGLGKTVEMIALISLHKRDQHAICTSPDNLPKSPATLIITPPAILQQWINELKGHAPSLKVFSYAGLRTEAKKSDHDELLSRCMQNDIVLTTYNVLAREVHYAETPKRDLRYEKKYKKRLTPLTQTNWWRVVLDEAQMMESGVSNAAKVAKLIPRELAWCVSGTPVKKDVRDLFGLLDFLHYEPYCNYSAALWNRLVWDHKDVLRQIFGKLALRHTKDQIRDELQLPPQKRVVITVPFTQIEEQHYSSLFKEMSEDCGLNLDGDPLSDDWDPDSSVVIEKMRTWLTRLRQTCLHPEVGQRNRKALGNTRGPLRTVGQVLEVMIEQNDTATRSEERALLLSKLRRGQIHEHAEESKEALGIWLDALREAEAIVLDCRRQLQAEIDQLAQAGQLAPSQDDESGSLLAMRTGPYRLRLRAALEIEHMCTFFVANAYYQIKSDDMITQGDSEDYKELERKEETFYEKAKLLRIEILQEARGKAEGVMQRISDKLDQRNLVEIPAIAPLKQHHGGIEFRRYVEKVEILIKIMQDQAAQLGKWRNETTRRLLSPLVDKESNDAQGDEYENSTKQMDEVYTYVDALRAIIADRHDIITGQDNELIKHEMVVALKQAREGQGHSPELLQQLLAIRTQLKPHKDVGSVRGLITEIRELKTGLRNSAERNNSRAAAELLIISNVLSKLQQISIEQMKAVMGLDREIELFKDAMNQRLEYYRQLQAVSDTVAPHEVEMTEADRADTLLRKKAQEAKMIRRIASMKSKGRYLVHLRAEDGDCEAQKTCIICTAPFENGILTSCGHSYCVDCIRYWWSAHRTCPTCKKRLLRDDFHQITFKPQELTVEEEHSTREVEASPPQSTEDSAIYSGIRHTTLNQIKNVDLDGSFGTKVDTLARHILWLRQHDPGAKAIVFSQYRDFLDVLAKAFKHFKIGWTGIDQKDGIQKFMVDPSKECFFLHAKAHSSGLNLVNATHVILCEPLINTAIELQAIARVHRIGQHQPTTVWMYLVEDTVEKAIYDISVTRRLAHMGQTGRGRNTGDEEMLESKIEAANTFEMEETPLANLLAQGSGGGEMVDKDDLWSCLFRQRPGQSSRVSRDAEGEVARHLGATAAEERSLDDMNNITNAF